jgi:hypothetical protein
MRNLVKLAAVAVVGVGMSMSVSVPSYATTDNVKDAWTYFHDCLVKLAKGEDTCGGPHTIDKGTGSIGGGSFAAYHRCYEKEGSDPS